ncbi:MAG: DUF3568 family protein [Candidatus Omnitrophota bacterium]|nr:DUF3568 family protein [Candidatus Omnitrophota bacterium]
METKRWRVVMLMAASLGLSGCALFLVGAGVAGGYAISKDAVQNVLDLPKEHVYDHALAVAKEMGMVALEDRAHGHIKAEIQDVNVTITVKPLTKKTVQLVVQGRNDFLMPKVDVAQEVYTKILERL